MNENARIGQLLDEVKHLIEKGDITQLGNIVEELNISEVEELISKLPEYGHVIINSLSLSRAINVFRILDAPSQVRIINKLPGYKISDILNELPPDDRTSFFEEIKDNDLPRLISFLSLENRKELFMLLSYPEDSIGRLMTPDFLSISKDSTVEKALEYIRKNGKETETIDVIYIVDHNGVLLDDLRIKELLISDPKTPILDLMDDRLISLRAEDSIEEGIKTFKMNNRVALPVIDVQGILLGIVTIDDMLWTADEEFSENLQRIGGTSALKEPYLDLPVFKLIWKRAGWLIILFVSELFTASVMQYYEEQLARVIVLAMFLPLMISSGGNSGSQASTLVIQAMATGEIKLNDWWKVFYREIISGLSLGLILGIVGFCRIFIWHIVFPDLYGDNWDLVAITVSLALIGIVLWGSLMGSMLPFILRKFGIDPATSSAPFVATLVDVTGLIIYLSIASWVFGPIMNG